MSAGGSDFERALGASWPLDVAKSSDMPVSSRMRGCAG